MPHSTRRSPGAPLGRAAAGAHVRRRRVGGARGWSWLWFALLDFLTDRSGYCEQFSATMAIMARVLGIPARVAVGFTHGEQQDDGSWLVRTHDVVVGVVLMTPSAVARAIRARR